MNQFQILAALVAHIQEMFNEGMPINKPFSKGYIIHFIREINDDTANLSHAEQTALIHKVIAITA